MSFWSNQRFLITGGAGFLGTHLTKQLKQRGGVHIFAPAAPNTILRKKTQLSDC